jgi:hypothetical protein
MTMPTTGRAERFPCGLRVALLVLACAAGLAGGVAGDAEAARRIPLVSIEARSIVDEPKRAARMRVRDARGRLVYRGRVAIELRGQSSLQFRKKSYALEARTAGGDERDVALLGMPADDDWLLLGAYADPSLMRDALAYRAARRMGRPASRTRFVELRLNGRPRGVYVLAERLELGRERVDADALVEMTIPATIDPGDEVFSLPVTGRVMRFDDVRNTVDKAALQARLLALDRAIAGQGSWQAMIDIPSAVDFVLLQELFRNQDAFVRSTYMQLTKDGRLMMGPPWDFDLSAGNVSIAACAASEGFTPADRAVWIHAFYGDAGFRSAMRERWFQLRRQKIVEDLVAAIADHARVLRRPAARNQRLWRVPARRIHPDQAVFKNHAAAVRALRGWLVDRAAWLDAEMARW